LLFRHILNLKITVERYRKKVFLLSNMNLVIGLTIKLKHTDTEGGKTARLIYYYEEFNGSFLLSSSRFAVLINSSRVFASVTS
jgi:hypothetical protein